MAEDDWYGPFSRGRWAGYLHLVGAVVIIVFAVAGFTFERQIVIDGVASPPSRWGDQIQWPPLMFGFLLLLVGAYIARRGDTPE